MISYYQVYDNWARDARQRGLEEKPLGGTTDIITGRGTEIMGLWDNDTMYGVLCSNAAEFTHWRLECDLPPDYTAETVDGDTHHFSKEPQ